MIGGGLIGYVKSKPLGIGQIISVDLRDGHAVKANDWSENGCNLSQKGTKICSEVLSCC